MEQYHDPILLDEPFVSGYTERFTYYRGLLYLRLTPSLFTVSPILLYQPFLRIPIRHIQEVRITKQTFQIKFFMWYCDAAQNGKYLDLRVSTFAWGESLRRLGVNVQELSYM